MTRIRAPWPLATPARFAALGGLLLSLACSNPDPILIGLAGPLSDPVGHPMARAAELAVETINAQGGINGRPIELVPFDDYGDPDSAVVVASVLRVSDVVAVIGHVWSSTTLAAGPVYATGNDPVPVISPSSSAPNATLGANLFRVCPTDDAHGAALAQFAVERLQARRAAVFYRNDDYGRGIRRTFARTFEGRNGTITRALPYLESKANIDLFLDLLVRDGAPDLLMVAGDRADALEILAKARARGLTMPILGGDGLEGIEADGAVAEGVFVSTAWLPDGARQEARAFLAAYARRFPDEAPPNQPAAAAWDIVHLLATLLRDVGPDRARLLKALGTVGGERPSLEGATGIIGFTDRGDLASGAIIISEVRGGKLVRAAGR